MRFTIPRFAFGLLLSAILAPPVAQAATLTATLSATLARDLDLSGTITCGDYLRYQLAIVPDATPPQGVLFDIPVDTNILFDPSSVTTTAPGATITPDPLSIRIAFGTIAAPVSATWEGQIRTLNTGIAVSIQGTLSGSNVPNTFTDGNPAVAGTQATVTPYTPCPPAPNVRATKTWSLATDSDGDGLVDPGDTITYTVLVNNGANPGLTANNVVFASGVDAASALVVGSASTTRGAVVLGNTAGDTSVRVNVSTLPSNTTATITFQVRVSPSTSVNSIACQGTVTGSNFSQVLTDDPLTPAPLDPTRTPLDHDPDLSLAKTDGGISAGPGQVVPYALAILNLTPFPAADVVLHETVPAGTTFNAAASSSGWTCTSNQCSLPVGALGANASASRTFAVRVATTLPAGTTALLNNASVSSADPDPSPANNLASDSTPLSGFAPDLAVTKSDGGTSAVPGQTLLYTLTSRNLGSIGSTGVSLNEIVPLLTTYDPAAAPGWSCAPNNGPGSSCGLLVGSLPAGAMHTALFAVRLDATLPAGSTSITNLVKLDDDQANGPDADPSNNSATLVTPIAGALPNLNVVKTVDPASNPAPGGLLLYNLTYTNTGNIGSPVVLLETVPTNTSFEPGSSTAGWICSSPAAGSSCSFDAGILAAGDQGVARFAVRVDPALPAGATLVLNCAQVRTRDVAGHRAAQDCLTVPLATRLDLALTKSDGGVSAAIGDTIAYTLTASNLGNLAASGVTFSEVVPDNSTFDPAASSPGWSCTSPAAGSVCTYTLGSLAVAETQAVLFAIHTLESTAGDFTAWVNTAHLADDGAGGADADPANNSATDSTPVASNPTPNASLLLHLVDSLAEDRGLPGLADPRDVIRYTATLSNPSATTARNVVFSLLSADPYTVLVAGSVTTDAGTVREGNALTDTTVAVDVGDLPGGASVTITFDVRVVNQLPDAVTTLAMQGIASGSNAPAIPSDDPATDERQDPTRTPVAPREVHEIPTVGTIGLLALALAFAFFAVRHLRPNLATSPQELPHA